MSECYSSNTLNKLNSQYFNIKKCLKCGTYVSCIRKCKCIFFFRSKNVQGTSSRHCQSGGIRARMKLLTLGTSLEFHVFFFHSSLSKQESSILEFISLYFPYEHSERLPSFFSLCPISISGIMNAKKKKLEIGEGRQEQWKPTSSPWNLLFLSREFSYKHS